MKFGIEILIPLLCQVFPEEKAEKIRQTPQNVIKFADSCVWTTVGGNFTSAKQTCNDDGGVIFTFNKTTDALEMLDQLNISYATPVYIGAIRIHNNGSSSFDWLSRPETWSANVVVDTSAEADYGYHSDIICIRLFQKSLSLANCSEIMPVTLCEYDNLLNCSVSDTITLMEMREEGVPANSAADKLEKPENGRRNTASETKARICPTAGAGDQEINTTCPLESSQTTIASKTEQGAALTLEHTTESTTTDGVDLTGGELMILPSENGFRITNFSSLLSEIVEKSNISKTPDQSPVPPGPILVAAPNLPGNSTSNKHSNITNGTLVREVQFQVANKDTIFSGGVQVSGLNSGSVHPFSPLLIDLHVQKTPQLVNTSRILNSLKQQEHVDNDTLMVFVDTVESTAVDRHISDEPDELKKDLFSDILSVGESLVKKIPASSPSMSVKTEKMVLSSKIMKDDPSNSKVLIEVDHPDTDTHIQLSKLVFECDDDEDVRVSTIAYKKMETFIKASNKHLSSSVVSVTVQYIKGNTTKKGKTRTGLKSVIRFEMKTDIDKGKQEDKRLCAFWDFSERKWSSAGCTVVAKNASHTTCECNHLTNFAILVMYIETENISLENQQALFTLTTVGCSLSIACLAMTLICYIYLKMLCKEKIMIHANLSIALLLGQIVFVASGDAHNDPLACKTIAVLLHFLFMASFTWMMVEGIALYLCCTKGIFHHRDMRAKYFLFGWGLPLVIVVISLAARFPDYGSGPQYSCWLSLKHGLIWAFLGPIIVIVVLNIGVMGLVIKCFLTLQANSEKTEVARLRGSLRAMMTLLPLLGVTWILSLLVPFSVIFHYFFVIFNTLQGMCIFFLHCICNEEIRKKFYEKRRRWSTTRTGSDGDMALPSRRKTGSFDAIRAAANAAPLPAEYASRTAWT